MGGGGVITCRVCTKDTDDDIGILARSCSAKFRPRKASNRNSNLGTVLVSISGLPLTNLKAEIGYFAEGDSAVDYQALSFSEEV